RAGGGTVPHRAAAAAASGGKPGPGAHPRAAAGRRVGRRRICGGKRPLGRHGAAAEQAGGAAGAHGLRRGLCLAGRGGRAVIPAALCLLGLAALGAGGWLFWQARRTLRRLDAMLASAIDGGFVEEGYDESAL